VATGPGGTVRDESGDEHGGIGFSNIRVSIMDVCVVTTE
jgi:hypothetical protein